nr:hypothetical protein BaRGS_030256 [Batillaria attramentaria]
MPTEGDADRTRIQLDDTLSRRYADRTIRLPDHTPKNDTQTGRYANGRYTDQMDESLRFRLCPAKAKDVLPASAQVLQAWQKADDAVDNQHWVFHGNSSTTGSKEKDGSLAAYVRDADGSLTGSTNAALVRDFPIYKEDECVDRPDWGMSVCPYRYIKSLASSVSRRVLPHVQRLPRDKAEYL